MITLCHTDSTTITISSRPAHLQEQSSDKFIVASGAGLNRGPGLRSDRLGEFGERCGDPQGGRCVQSEFVVTVSDVCVKACPAMMTLAVRSRA